MSRRSTATSSARSVNSAWALAAAVAVGLCGLRLGAQTPPRQAPGTPTRTLSRTTDHLTLSATLSAAAIAPGRRVTLTADVKPKAGMHVYAPGSQYRAVAITLESRSPFRLDAPVEYPKPALYTFKPLDEQVLVYDTPFRLVAQLALDPARPFVTPLQRPATFALNASLDYQACDDRVCYLPESVPLRWSLTLLPSSGP
jgi:DsbC/DsbD-like thiol-disulfide interchange protein